MSASIMSRQGPLIVDSTRQKACCQSPVQAPQLSPCMQWRWLTLADAGCSFCAGFAWGCMPGPCMSALSMSSFCRTAARSAPCQMHHHASSQCHMISLCYMHMHMNMYMLGAVTSQMGRKHVCAIHLAAENSQAQCWWLWEMLRLQLITLVTSKRSGPGVPARAMRVCSFVCLHSINTLECSSMRSAGIR